MSQIVDSAHGVSSINEFLEMLTSVASSDIPGYLNGVWDSLIEDQRIPFVVGDQVAFLYRGAARSVRWVGDFNGWHSGSALEGKQVSSSDIWAASATFPIDSRVEYLILVDDRNPMLDPANPLQQAGGFGSKSVVAMPEYVFPSEIIPRKNIPTGQLGEPTSFSSSHLGYKVNYRVYTPAEYSSLTNLPVVYFTDGQDYADPRMGNLPTVLDNLVADHIVEPILAVLIDPRDPTSGRNRRQEEFLRNPNYAAFVTEELVPQIDHSYGTNPSPDQRALAGASYGGYFAAYCGLHYHHVFHKLGLQSPFLDTAIYSGYRAASRLPLSVFLSTGTWDFNVNSMKEILEEKAYPLKYLLVSEGHSWGQWRSQLDDLFIYFFGRNRPVDK